MNVLKGSFNRDVYCPTAVKKMSTEHLRTDPTRLDTSHKLFGKRVPYSVLAEQK